MSNRHPETPDAYYAFDDQAREVLIKRHDTPTPWINYLSNGRFHTMMSQAGGALAFYRSPQIWRINRYRFFHLPTDRSGLYYYIQDRRTGAYWCPTREPAALKPESWQAAHGMGYTRFTAEHDGVRAEPRYFVGPFADCVIWNLRLSNTADETRDLNLFAYVEFGMMEFLRELSWVCYNKHQLKVVFDREAAAIVYDYAVEMQPKPRETPLVYLAADTALAGHDCDRDEFVGSYRSETNPFAIENGGCTQSELYGGDPCGALQIRVTLAPGEQRTINTFLGAAPAPVDVRAALKTCREPGFVERSWAALRADWERYLGRFACALPDAEAQRQVNTWNPYQAQRNFQFSRNISFYATGTFRGVGFRDTAQDVLAVTPFDNGAAQLKLLELLGQQYADGHTNHYYFPTEGWDPLKRLHSDNHIWPILGVWDSVMEAGTTDFLEAKAPFFDGGDATVYDHLCRSVDFTRAHLGKNGFPLMLTSDWNDMLYKVCREGKGESIWMAMFLGYALPKLAELARLLGREEDARRFMAFWEQQRALVDTLAWDGRWFRRATMDSGEFLGTASAREARIWLNAQTWSVISGMPERAKMIRAMDSVAELLDTELGIRKIHPPIVNFPTPADPLSHYNKGCGENGAIFCHANTWAIIAEAMLGRGDRAWKYYRQLIPSVAMAKAGPWRYKAEPYVYASNLFGPESDRFGLANVSWLTGTAAWMYVAVTQHILGIRPTWRGLEIAPCLPPDWERAEVTRQFRGATYRIALRKPRGICKGPIHLQVNGRPVEGVIVPPGPAGATVAVVAEIGGRRR